MIKRLLIVLILVAPSLASCQELTIAAAADLQFAMKDISARFEKQSGAHVNVIYGSSGTFYQQLQNGAPFDLFFSADIDYPKKLESEHLAEPGSYFEYGRGRIVVWERAGSKLDLGQGLRAMLNPSVHKVAIANPQHAPYGKAAVAAMQHEQLYDQLKTKLVFGENISQAANFVASGSADVGVIALALAVSPSMKNEGRFVEVPAGEYPPIRQACVIVGASRHKQLARMFRNFMESREVAELLKSYGFDVPPFAR